MWSDVIWGDLVNIHLRSGVFFFFFRWKRNHSSTTGTQRTADLVLESSCTADSVFSWVVFFRKLRSVTNEPQRTSAGRLETAENTSGLHSVQCVQCGFARQGDDRESSQSGEWAGEWSECCEWSAENGEHIDYKLITVVTSKNITDFKN